MKNTTKIAIEIAQRSAVTQNTFGLMALLYAGAVLRGREAGGSPPMRNVAPSGPDFGPASLDFHLNSAYGV